MECNEIKSLLSEYLDKTLQNDLSMDVKEHLLSCKNCSNEFFLMKSITEELADLERFKAPNYLLNRVNQAVTSPSLLSRILDFIPGSGGFKVPMEFVTLATTVVLVFLIFTNIHFDNNENTMIARPGSHENAINDKPNGPVRLDFIPATSSEYAIPDARVPSSDNTDPSDLFDMIEKDMPVLHQDNLISDLQEMILLAEGDIISREYSQNSRNINAITVKIPLNSYNSFIKNLKKIGEFISPPPSLSHQSPDPVILHIRLNVLE